MKSGVDRAEHRALSLGRASASAVADVVEISLHNRFNERDGESRIMGPGEMLLIEDTHGKGHVHRP